MALARRARESSDVTFYAQGEEAVQESLAVAADNYGALQARAWILLGKHEFAEALTLATTLNTRVPDDLGFLTDANAELGNYAEAVKQRLDAAPHPENLYDLAEALELAGRADEAAEAFAQFEAKSLAETGRADNSNRELIFYYADHAGEPAKALEAAEREYARRRDVHTLDAYAWALHVNGRDAEARQRLETALAIGTRDSRLLRHSRETPAKFGDQLP
jgi:tetratricopeptide (TPR) repeat protein